MPALRIESSRITLRLLPMLALAGWLGAALTGCGGSEPTSLEPPPAATAAGLSRPGAVAAAVAARPEAPPARTASAAAPGDDAAQLRRQVVSLQREVDALWRRVGRDEAKVDASASPRHDPAARAEAENAERLRSAQVESTFQREVRDERWSAPTAASVQRALAEDGGTLREAVRSIECRAQTCRVEINDDGTGPSAAMMPVFINRMASVLPTVAGAQVDQGNGSMATVLYLSR